MPSFYFRKEFSLADIYSIQSGEHVDIKIASLAKHGERQWQREVVCFRTRAKEENKQEILSCNCSAGKKIPDPFFCFIHLLTPAKNFALMFGILMGSWNKISAFVFDSDEGD